MREELVALLKTASRLCSDRGNSSSIATSAGGGQVGGGGGVPGEEVALCSELTSLVRTALGSGAFPSSSATSTPVSSHHSPGDFLPGGYYENGTYFNNNNGTWNGSLSDLDQPYYGNFIMAMLSVVLGIVILITVIGNVFVIAAILLERNLQNVANYLIVSLAVADLMVACLVMPLGAVYEISQGWILGPELCDMWTSSDVLCCTASILHLVAIAVDRYWAVTNVDYIHTRNGSRIVAMIVVVWSVALVVSLAPQFGWKDPDYLDRINVQQKCLVSQDLGYQIFATCSTFYVPLLVILVLYWKIFQTARKRIRRRRTKPSQLSCETKLKATGRFKFLSKKKLMGDWEKNKGDVALVEGSVGECDTEKGGSDGGGGGGGSGVTDSATAVAGAGGDGTSNGEGGGATTAFTIDTNHGVIEAVQLQVSPERSTAEIVNNSKTTIQATVIKHHHKREGKKESMEAKRERKAAKTLAIITGAFVVCWLPFFIMALLMPLCHINDYLSSLFLWLGYFNSTLNPVIYTIFSPEFRQAFKRMLCGVSHTRPRKLR